jgi:5,10-methylene-tetrahydrofolate dehydrogenase/methenyl tetrahydrofolate cyclohydrolase
VDFEGVKKKASWIPAVPGSVDPLTVTMLIKNTLRGRYRWRHVASDATHRAS